MSNKMKICLLVVGIIGLLYVESSLGKQFESIQHNEIADQLAQLKAQFNQFKAEVKDEIDHLKTQNFEQAEEIRLLKEELNSRPPKADKEERASGNKKQPNRESASPRALPASCRQLDTLGYTLDGFYILQNLIESKMKLVYCEFSPAVSETLVGNIDVKTTEVHFYVQRTSSYSFNNAVIQFDRERLNIGGAMDMNTGIFFAPVNGIYQFEFNGVKDTSTNYLYIYLQVNGANIGVATAPGNVGALLESVIHASLELKAGDRVALFKTTGILYDAIDNYYSHFTGRLVYQNLVLA